jgi:DNA-binding XRE family transcriptional regulator
MSAQVIAAAFDDLADTMALCFAGTGNKSALCMIQCVAIQGRLQDTIFVEKNLINYKEVLGKRVRALRLESELSQESLSARCGIFRTYLSRIESGSANPSIAVMVSLAMALSVLPHELLIQD